MPLAHQAASDDDDADQKLKSVDSTSMGSVQQPRTALRHHVTRCRLLLSLPLSLPLDPSSRSSP